MQDLLLPFSEAEKMQLGDELTRLFALQDMALGKEKKGIFVAELCATGMPCEAIIKGIRSLVSNDLKAIKLSLVIDAARPFIYHEEETKKCEECIGGIIPMHDADRREYALSCRCPSGQIKGRSMGLTVWQGQDTQFSKGRMLTRS